MTARYIVRIGAPFFVRVQQREARECFVYDTLLAKNVASYGSYESASARAYILNRFSTGACA